MLLHFDSAHKLIQTIPAYSRGRGGYAKPEAQADVSGGYKGMMFELSRASKGAARKFEVGHEAQWWPQGSPVYAGQITVPNQECEGQTVLSGVVAEWATRQPGDKAWTTGSASGIMRELVTTYGPGALLSTSTDYIPLTSTYTAPAQTFSKQKIQDIITTYNAYEGFEYGGFIPAPGASLAPLTAFFYHAADVATLNLSVPAAKIAGGWEPPQPDADKFGTKIRVYYDAATSAPGYSDVAAIAAAVTKHGTIWAPSIDLSGAVGSTAAAATQAGTKYMEGLRVDGVETPPVSVEIKLDASSRHQAFSGATRSLYSIRPGMNILVTGLGMPRSLTATDSLMFFHITAIRWTDHSVTLSAGRSYDPSVLLAQLKGAA